MTFCPAVITSQFRRKRHWRVCCLNIEQELHWRDGSAREALNGAQPIILVTHKTTEEAVRQALAKIAADGHLVAQPQVIRIER